MPSIPLIPRLKFIKALRRLGYRVDTDKGKGSHYKLYGFDGKSITIPATLESPKVRSTLGNFLVAQGTDMETLKEEL